MVEKITQILNIHSHKPDHHLERPYLTGYQIAIQFKKNFRSTFDLIGKPIGGKDTGQHDSLSQYIAQGLSREIKNEKITHIEGSFISRMYLSSLTFDDDGENIVFSGGQSYDHALFRLID